MSGPVRVLQPYHRASLVHGVDRLVREASVRDVSVRHPHACLDSLISIYDIVVLLIVGLEPVQNRYRVRDVGMLHDYLLEPPVQSSVLFDDLAEFIHRSRADTLDVASGKCRFQHVGGIKTSGCSSGSYNSVELIYEEDDIGTSGHLVDYGF